MHTLSANPWCPLVTPCKAMCNMCYEVCKGAACKLLQQTTILSQSAMPLAGCWLLFNPVGAVCSLQFITAHLGLRCIMGEGSEKADCGRTHARVSNGMYIRRGMHIICCSARMAFMACFTVYRGSSGGIRPCSSFLRGVGQNSVKLRVRKCHYIPLKSVISHYKPF